MSSFSERIFNRFFSKSHIGGEISINDLKDREFSGVLLSTDEKLALVNYDNYRVKMLNAQESEEEFHQMYRKLQVIANLGDWREFLKDEYCS